MTTKDKTYTPTDFLTQELAEGLAAESERALGIELSGGGWSALADAIESDDWDSAAECEKRALPRLTPPTHFSPLPPLHATTAAVSRSKLAERDEDGECIGFFRRWDLEQRGTQVRTYCSDCLDWHTGASREELEELLDLQHPPDRDPDEAWERKRDLR